MSRSGDVTLKEVTLAFSTLRSGNKLIRQNASITYNVPPPLTSLGESGSIDKGKLRWGEGG
jgi:hypothetical protein